MRWRYRTLKVESELIGLLVQPADTSEPAHVEPARTVLEAWPAAPLRPVDLAELLPVDVAEDRYRPEYLSLGPVREAGDLPAGDGREEIIAHAARWREIVKEERRA